MKIVLVVTLALFGAVYAAPQVSIQQELLQFIAVLPLDKIRLVYTKHLDNDDEFKTAIKYIQTDEWKTMVKALHTKPSMKKIFLTIKDAGLDLETWDKLACSYLENLNVVVADGHKRSFSKFLTEIDTLIPYEELLALLANKLENSPTFIKFFNVISSGKMKELVDKVMASAEFRKFSKELIYMDVPVHEIVGATYVLLGWKSEGETVNDL